MGVSSAIMMLHAWRVWSAIGALLPVFFSDVAAQTLRPIRPSTQDASTSAGLAKRSTNALELRDHETFLWGAQGKSLNH